MQTWVVYSVDLSHKSIAFCSQSPKIMANSFFFDERVFIILKYISLFMLLHIE